MGVFQVVLAPDVLAYWTVETIDGTIANAIAPSELAETLKRA